MKQVFTFLLALLACQLVLAQSVPQSFSYQAIARDAQGNCLAGQTISLRISILDGSSTGLALYQEIHQNVLTNSVGHFRLNVGKGTQPSGDFADIDWREDTRFLKVELDPGGGTNFNEVGVTQLLSVPYALAADGAITSTFADSAALSGNAATADFATTATSATTATFADSAAVAGNAATADFATSAGTATSATTSTFADSAAVAGNAATADFATFAGTATFADSANVSAFAYNGKLTDSQGADSMAYVDAAGVKLIELTTQSADEGKIHVYSDGDIVGTFRSTGGTGNIGLAGSNGSLNMTLGAEDPSNPDYGLISIRDNSNNTRVKAWSQSDRFGAGNIVTYGSNGNINTTIGSGGANFENKGTVTIRDENGVVQVGLFIDASGLGVVAKDVNNFFMDHPTQPGKEIWYASIEGPEAAAYERGTATLVNGEAEITFAEHFQIVANPSTMTITTSPWSADAKGLAVVERTATGFKVKELFGGTGNYQFDWRVDAKRKGFEDFQVIRDKKDGPHYIEDEE